MNNQITLTESQKRVLKELTDFVASDNRFFILKGYAGTGKTTLMRFFIQHLLRKEIDFKLLAPTGRAAKVLSDAVFDDRFDQAMGVCGQTIHGLIYSYSGFNREVSAEEIKSSHATGQLSLVFEPVKPDRDDDDPVVYIVDEASMISDEAVKDSTQAVFGSGKLLTELLEYDTRPESKFVFVGDPCQLPPVGTLQSPALTESWFHPTARSASLTEIMRQDNGNDLIRISKQIRNLVANAPEDDQVYGSRKIWTKLPLRHSPSIVLHPDVNDMVNQYEDALQKHGYNHCVFISKSNKSNCEIVDKVRASLGYGGALPQPGELLMVIQNNHRTALVNGDMVVVEKVNPAVRGRAGLSFVEARVKECVSNRVFTIMLLLDTLNSNQLNLSQVQQTNLFVDFFIRMHERGIRQGSQAFATQLNADPYLNALRCVYGYAVTCHKAQGGEWDEVFLNLPRNIGLNPTKQSYRWLYTAITRAKTTLHLVDDRLYLQ